MYSHSRRSTSVSRAAEGTEKSRAAFTPTVSSEDGDSFSDQEEAASRRCQSHSTTSGLFIPNPTGKPMPMSVQRTIPLPSLWKAMNGSKPSKAAPDILRRTGSTSALFSQDSTFQKTVGDGQDSWTCRHCNYENMDSFSCALCGIQLQQSHQKGYQQQERHLAEDRSKHGAAPKLLRQSQSMPLDFALNIHGDVKTPIHNLGVQAEEIDEYAYYSSHCPGLLSFVKQKLGKSANGSVDCRWSDKSCLTRTIFIKQGENEVH